MPKKKNTKNASAWAKALGIAAAVRLLPARRLIMGLALAAGAIYAWQKLTDDDD